MAISAAAGSSSAPLDATAAESAVSRTDAVRRMAVRWVYEVAVRVAGGGLVAVVLKVVLRGYYDINAAALFVVGMVFETVRSNRLEDAMTFSTPTLPGMWSHLRTSLEVVDVAYYLWLYFVLCRPEGTMKPQWLEWLGV